MNQEINYTEVNKKMWELTADIYEANGFQEALQRVQHSGFSTFDEVEKKLFNSEIQLKAKSVIQIGCNNGTELITLKKNGAEYCLGVDISEKFIQQARQLAKASGHYVDFETTDIYKLDESYFWKFD